MPALWKLAGTLIFTTFCATAFAQNETLPKKFPPKGFVFGCATSAYQIEGAWNEDGKGPSLWDRFIHDIPGYVSDNTSGDVACDHYHRYKEDVQVFKKLGVNHYSFTIAWSRILPKGKGEVNRKGLAFYNNLVNELIKNGITPIATLYHWDLPAALEDEYGGWLSDKIVKDFENYAHIVFSSLADRVHMWSTFNEPPVVCIEGYRAGDNPPGRCSDRDNCPKGNSSTEPWICGHHILNAHAAAVRVFRTEFQKKHPGQIGIILDNTWTEPLDPRSKPDRAAAERSMQFYLGWFAHPIWVGDYPPMMRKAMGSILPTFTAEQLKLLKGSSDYFAWDVYTAQWATPSRDPKCPHDPSNELWPECVETMQRIGDETYGKLIGAPAASDWFFIVPRSMKLGLHWIRDRYHPPTIYITENGIDVPKESEIPLDQALDDMQRVWFYQKYLESLKEAWDEGIPVKGYIYWSCMDNFEWNDGGLDFRFGTTYVDFKTQKRTLKKSAHFLRKYFNDGISLEPRHHL